MITDLGDYSAYTLLKKCLAEVLAVHKSTLNDCRLSHNLVFPGGKLVRWKKEKMKCI